MRRLGILLATAGLVLAGSPAVAAEVPPAEATGTLRVTTSDFRGPAAGAVTLLRVGGGGWAEDGMRASGASTLELEVPPGRYAVTALTPWGGVTCAGVTPCDFWSLVTDHTTVTGVVDVVAGEVSTYALGAPAPASIAPTSYDEDLLELSFSGPMEQLAFYLQGMAEFGHPEVQWLRDGADIPGATGRTYRPVVADAGTQLGARLTFHPYAVSYLKQQLDADVAPVVVEGPALDRVASVVTARLRPDVVDRGERASLVTRVPDGVGKVRVRVAVSDWRGSCTLVGERCTVRLPRLRPGVHLVTATYGGSAVLLPGRSHAEMLIVRK